MGSKTVMVELERLDLTGLLYALYWYQTHGLFGHQEGNKIEERLRAAVPEYELIAPDELRPHILDNIISVERERRKMSWQELMEAYGEPDEPED